MSNTYIEEIIEKYGDMVYRLALIYTRNNREDASDIFQDVFLLVIKKQKKFNDMEHCKAWLIKSTINLCKKNYFKRKDILLQNAIIKNESEDTTYQMSAESSKLYECICKLPEKYRVLITLYYFEGFSGKEISEYLGITEASVRKRLSRGRKILKEYMEE